MDRIEVAEAFFQKASARLAHLVAVEIDVGEQKAGKNKEGAGGEEPHAGQLCQERHRAALRVLMKGVIDHHIAAEQEAQPFQTNKTLF